ncbi:FHA domain-containing protein [Pyrobaculum sp. 3827-6]|uniref:FHA domain-containing protein n=1 Tax=Pyrobaculum sp. 3827-6 TaxID=2983604 RepID=UPI0021D81E99|nr:FHA domain-containing protein [Pyrobaculum sp. 3827-6]MCU7786710.1 FHA domain-containing protein [Pyrobaculum sp. 3827-6]
MEEKTETLDIPIQPLIPPLPPLQPAEQTQPIKPTKKPPYTLTDPTGRYKLSTTNYAEYGRDHFLDLGEDAQYISRKHFALKYQNGTLYIKDLGSKNGTKLNGVDIRGKDWQPLKPGDEIEIADVIKLKVVTDNI